jgi:hypothetical protein
VLQRGGQKERARASAVLLSVSLILIGWRPFWIDGDGFWAALLDFDLEKYKIYFSLVGALIWKFFLHF